MLCLVEVGVRIVGDVKEREGGDVDLHPVQRIPGSRPGINVKRNEDRHVYLRKNQPHKVT